MPDEVLEPASLWLSEIILGSTGSETYGAGSAAGTASLSAMAGGRREAGEGGGWLRRWEGGGEGKVRGRGGTDAGIQRGGGLLEMERRIEIDVRGGEGGTGGDVATAWYATALAPGRECVFTWG